MKFVGGADSSHAAVEGRVEPSDVEAKVYLSRGGEIDSTVTHDGWFQLSDVDYGLYILEARAEGYGGERRLISVSRSMVLVEPLRLETHPWPISRVSPRDSAVLRGNPGDNSIGIRFNRFMDRSTVGEALRMEPACPLSLRWEEVLREDLGDYLYVAIEPGDLEFGEQYTLILDTSARTREGHALEKEFSLPVVRRSVIPGEDATPEFDDQGLSPLDSIRIDFPQAMDMASVNSRISLLPSMDFTPVWDIRARSVRIVPITKWTPGDYLTVEIASGYRSATGQTGSAVSARKYVHAFGLEVSRSGWSWGFGNEHITVFNMPVDFSSLKFRMDSPVTAVARQTAPDSILWSFSGGVPGQSYYLRIEALHSRLGDSLVGAIGVRYEPTGPDANLRFLDPAQERDGIRPNGDTLRAGISMSAIERLGSASFSLLPGFPMKVSLLRNPAGGAVLAALFPQPLPAGTYFKLFPDTGAVTGDTLEFSTRFLAAQVLQPLQGEAMVEPSRTVELLWNTQIDTIGFADRIWFEPPVDSLRIEQDTAAGGHLTRILHAPFAKGTSYSLKAFGITDRFAQGLEDTLKIRFKTRP